MVAWDGNARPYMRRSKPRWHNYGPMKPQDTLPTLGQELQWQTRQQAAPTISPRPKSEQRLPSSTYGNCGMRISHIGAARSITSQTVSTIQQGMSSCGDRCLSSQKRAGGVGSYTALTPSTAPGVLRWAALVEHVSTLPALPLGAPMLRQEGLPVRRFCGASSSSTSHT